MFACMLVSCSAQGKCVCLTRLTSTLCETSNCSSQSHFSPSRFIASYSRRLLLFPECPGNRNKCGDGPSGTGAFLSSPLPSNALSKHNCLNGTCHSFGTCTCVAEWATAPSGTAYEKCDAGFSFNVRTNSCCPAVLAAEFTLPQSALPAPQQPNLAADSTTASSSPAALVRFATLFV
jgi:hypothetical protein